MIPHSEWKWSGSAAHFICGRWCRFHMATEIGPWLVSTVGEFVHPSDSGASEATEAAYLTKNPLGKEIGYKRLFETMVFRVTGHCDQEGCRCGLPLIEGTELDTKGYNDRAAANAGHLELCERWAAKEVVSR